MAAMLMCCRRTDHRLWSECLSNECRHGPDGWSDTQSLQSPLLLAVPTRLLHSGHYTRYFFYFSILCYMQFSWRTSDFYWCFLLLCKICWDDKDFMFLTCLCSWFIYGSHSPGKSGKVQELIWSGKVGECCWWSRNFGSLRTKTAIFVYVSGQSSYSLMCTQFVIFFMLLCLFTLSGLKCGNDSTGSRCRGGGAD